MRLAISVVPSSPNVVLACVQHPAACGIRSSRNLRLRGATARGGAANQAREVDPGFTAHSSLSVPAERSTADGVALAAERYGMHCTLRSAAGVTKNVRPNSLP
jgi:hypothetical protein